MPVNVPVPIIKGDRVSVDVDYRDALPVNLIGIPKEIDNTKGYFVTHSGLAHYADTFGACRGAVWNERLGIHFRVSGNKLIALSASGEASILGEITGTDQVSMPYSFSSQAIIADGKYYRYTIEDGLERISDKEVGRPIDGTWIDNFYFFTDGEYLYHTTLTSETNIDGLDYATSEFSPDPTLAVDKDFDDKVIAFNRYTTEYFTNTASETFAFTRIQSRAKSVGIIGTHCKCSVANAWAILGGGKKDQASIYLISASSELKIATREIDLILSEYSEEQLSKAVLESRTENDVELVLVRLPNNTLVYNHTIAKVFGINFAWSVIRSTILTDGTWPGANGVYDPRTSKWIYGDIEQARLGELTPNSSTIYSGDIESIFYSPYITINNQILHKVKLKTTPGASIESAKVFISATYDGVTYGTETTVLYGKPNSRNTIFESYGFGYIEERIGLKFRSVGKAKLTFAKLEIDYD